jgi:hypothetical protein
VYLHRSYLTQTLGVWLSPPAGCRCWQIIHYLSIGIVKMQHGAFEPWRLVGRALTGLFVVLCFDLYPMGSLHDCLFHCVCLRATPQMRLVNARSVILDVEPVQTTTQTTTDDDRRGDDLFNQNERLGIKRTCWKTQWGTREHSHHFSYGRLGGSAS